MTYTSKAPLDPTLYRPIYRSDGTPVADIMYILTYHAYYEIPHDIPATVSQKAFELQLAWPDFVEQYPEEFI